jgi:Uma2 family endonuclease
LWPGINVCDAPVGWENYRVPDLTFVAAGREAVVAPDGVRFGAPDAVIEVRSPDDETSQKLPFFAALGVREVIVIDRDTKNVELFALHGAEYAIVPPDADGWRNSSVLGVRFRTAAEAACVAVEDAEQSGHRAEI